MNMPMYICTVAVSLTTWMAHESRLDLKSEHGENDWWFVAAILPMLQSACHLHGQVLSAC